MKTAFICVCSKERLDQYKVLYASILKHCWGVTPILYYGGDDNPTDVGEVVDIRQWVSASKYNDDWYIYCSLRPKAILDAFSKGYDKVILLGSDTEFFDNPYEANQELNNNDCFVTMYTHEPYGHEEDIYPNDWQTVEVGQINADFIGFRNNESVHKFMHWLDNTLSDKIVYKNKIYLDQGWFSMVFSFLDNVKIIRHLGYNVANYNLHNRGMWLRKAPDTWRMRDNTPLVLFHYAGFVKGKEESISKHQNRYKAQGEILEFLRNYGSKVNK